MRVAGLLLGSVIALAYIVPLPTSVAVETSVVTYAKQGVLLRSYLTSDEKWRHPVGGTGFDPDNRLSALPEFFVPGLLCLEDARYFWHPGFDPAATVRAAYQNFQADRIVSGGSTITMQLVRLLEPRPRTFKSKLVELLRAVQLEMRLSKKEILDLYLTYAPYGGNIEGIEAASQSYFGHGSNRLTQGEAAFLYLLPQAPGRFLSLDRVQLKALRARVLDRLQQCEVLTASQRQEAERVRIPVALKKPVIRAPHLADYLQTIYPGKNHFNTTIDVDLQRSLEDYIGQLKGYYYERGVHNISVLVVDNDSGGIAAALGNFSYFDVAHGQAYSSFSILRSPGSTLKPFLYAYLIGRGDLLPQSLLLDIPSKYENYSPENFSGLYSGLVRAEDALAQSLNIPFVRELQRLGLDEFLAFLEAGGLTRHTPVEDLGLSTVIGAIELSALELTQLYTGLAGGGNIKPLRLLRSEDRPAYGWLPPAAVYLTDKALAKRDRPDFPGGGLSFRAEERVHWKTGTSQGRRDAWSIGYRDRYTVSVWLGNLDNTSSPLLTGAEASAPLMFRIFSMLKETRPSPQPIPYDELTEVRICSFSGWKATEHCPHTERVTAVGHHPLSRPCPYHDRVLVDLDSGLRVTKSCEENLRTGFKSVMTVPQDILFWMRHSLRNLTPKPSFHPQCTSVPTEPGKITIKKPLTDGTYYLTQGHQTLPVPLELESTASLADTACYLNGEQIDLSGMSFRPYLHVPIGKHHLYCADLFGKSDGLWFSVLSTTL